MPGLSDLVSEERKVLVYWSLTFGDVLESSSYVSERRECSDIEYQNWSKLLLDSFAQCC
jgi:hypothetical protein